MLFLMKNNLRKIIIAKNWWRKKPEFIEKEILVNGGKLNVAKIGTPEKQVKFQIGIG